MIRYNYINIVNLGINNSREDITMRLDEHKELKSKQESTDTLRYMGEEHYEESFHCETSHNDTNSGYYVEHKNTLTLLL